MAVWLPARGGEGGWGGVMSPEVVAGPEHQEDLAGTCSQIVHQVALCWGVPAAAGMA